ncbi:MAG: DUF547 domain-containing protein [Acidobacteria bacterium]|nr:DUF547 domain-containing protein [Acidobacteriota bacterium]
MPASAIVASVLAVAVAASPGFDHSPFDELLRRHVTDGLVDYDAFARSPEFRAYLEALASARLEGLSELERLAFWINAYNAWTIEQVNAHEERESIRKINKTLGVLPLKGPWSERMVRAAGRTLSLDEVEHLTIRKQFDEPRIHFALVCAALGCPPLRSEAYTGRRLEEQLEEQARTFLRHSPLKNRVDVAERTVWASPILTWYMEDFGGTNESLGRFLARYWSEGPEQELLLSGTFRLRKTDYDWTLNSVEKGLSRSPE